MDGSSLLGNTLRVDRANERKERPAFDSRGPPPSRGYDGERVMSFAWLIVCAGLCFGVCCCYSCLFACRVGLWRGKERPAVDSRDHH